MRRVVDSFRGEIPRVTPRALPDNASRGAVNPRLLSGDAEQWRQFLLTEVLENAGAVRTIYLLAGEFWLSWEEDVDVAKGVIPGDTTHRTYITGLDLPRWTNVDMATGGAKPWPFETRPLGVPPPDAAPTLVVGVDTSSSATFAVDVLDTGDTPLPWNFSPFSEFHGGVRFAFQDSGFGNPPGSYQLLYDDNPGAPAYAIRDFGIGAAAVVTVSWDAQMTSGSNNQAQMCAGLMRAADGANGLLVYFDLMSNQLWIGVAPGWQRIGQSGLASDASSIGFAFDAWYSFTASIVVNSNNTITVTAKAFFATVEVASVTTTLGATLGGYVGFYAEVDGNDPNGGNDGIDRYRTYIDNIHVQASGTAGYAPQNVATSYLITFVNDVGEESAPSLPSATALRPDGVSITVTSTTSVPTGISADYHITTKRIYRAVTGATGSAFRFVAEIPLAQADYVDVLPDSQLGEVLESDGWDLPPDDLRGILALPNGIMVGYRENEICLTPKNRPHAWPISFRLATDKKVVAIGAIDALVVVGTEGNPYLAGGNDPSQYSMTKLQVPQACVAKRGLASLGDFGVVFPSPDGLIAIAGTGQWKNLTSSVFTRDQWQALRPETIVAVAHDDVYHFFYTQHPPPAAVGLLMHCDNLADGSVFIDNSGDNKTINRVTDLSQAAPSIKFGAASGGTSVGRATVGPYADLGFAGDFGVDMWSKNANGIAFNKRTFFSNRQAAGAGMGFELCQDGDFLRYRSSDGTTVSGTTPIPDLTVAHIACERLNGVIHTYVNGVPEFTVLDSRDFSANTTLCFWDNFGTDNTFNGSLDEIRVVTDRAPYGGAGFTPPTAPYPDPGTVTPPPEFGYALDMKPDGFGLIQLGYHAAARFADPVTDNLYLVLDSVSEPTDDMLPIQSTPPTPDPQTIFQFNSPDSEAFLTYRWQSKLYLLERPGSFQFCRVDANNYDNLVLRMYRQVQLISPGNVWLDSLVYELVVRNDKPFTLPTRNQYRRFWFELVGTSSVQGVHFGESIEEVA